jgi:hypothetical protein
MKTIQEHFSRLIITLSILLFLFTCCAQTKHVSSPDRRYYELQIENQNLVKMIKDYKANLTEITTSNKELSETIRSCSEKNEDLKNENNIINGDNQNLLINITLLQKLLFESLLEEKTKLLNDNISDIKIQSIENLINRSRSVEQYVKNDDIRNLINELEGEKYFSQIIMMQKKVLNKKYNKDSCEWINIRVNSIMINLPESKKKLIYENTLLINNYCKTNNFCYSAIDQAETWISNGKNPYEFQQEARSELNKVLEMIQNYPYLKSEITKKTVTLTYKCNIERSVCK